MKEVASMVKSNWGGKRSNAGRKKLPDTSKKKGCTLQLSPEDIKLIDSFKGKNRSEKLRNILDEYRNLKKQIDFSKQ